jgi:hypothetical protein
LEIKENNEENLRKIEENVKNIEEERRKIMRKQLPKIQKRVSSSISPNICNSRLCSITDLAVDPGTERRKTGLGITVWQPSSTSPYPRASAALSPSCSVRSAPSTLSRRGFLPSALPTKYGTLCASIETRLTAVSTISVCGKTTGAASLERLQPMGEGRGDYERKWTEIERNLANFFWEPDQHSS